MTDMKCPFCQQELKELYSNGFSVGFRCKNKNCPETNIMCGTKALWQELIRIRKELDVAVDALDRMVIDDNVSGIVARNAIKEIKALEQKDK